MILKIKEKSECIEVSITEESNVIPKKIHYCWFGHIPLPDLALKCIASWKKYLPDYEIIEWNESNYDINVCDYVREAYKAKKWAFVSDYARFDILYRFGGLYFDTDVELIRSIDDIVKNGSFMGCEPNYDKFAAAPGLGLAAAPGLNLYQNILENYRIRHFIRSDGSFDQKTVVTFVTEILVEYGFDIYDHSVQKVKDVSIYPADYFCPMDYLTGDLNITENTRSIHHYSATWHTGFEKIASKITKRTSNSINVIKTFGYLISLVFMTLDRIQKIGVKGTLKFIMRYIKTLVRNSRGGVFPNHYLSISCFTILPYFKTVDLKGGVTA